MTQTDITTTADAIKDRCTEIYEYFGFDLRTHRCPSPTHSGDNNSGAFSIYRTIKGETRCTCFSHHCFEASTALDIIAANYSLSLPRDYVAAVELGAQILGLPFYRQQRTKYRSTPRRQQPQTPPQPKEQPPQPPQPLAVEQYTPTNDTTTQSEFFRYLVALFGDEARVLATLQRYGVCTHFSKRLHASHYVHKTRFLFGVGGSVYSFKDIEYLSDGHRNKETQIYQFAPQGVRCLFGEHLISAAVKTLSIHEAEKTAIVEALHTTAADVLPLAVGGFSQIHTLTASTAVAQWLASSAENNIVLFLDGDKSGTEGDEWRRVAQQLNEIHSRTCCYVLEYSQYCRIYHGDPNAKKGDLADVLEFAIKNSHLTTKAAKAEQVITAEKITSKNAVFVENAKSGLSVGAENEPTATQTAPQIAPSAQTQTETAAPQTAAKQPYKYNLRSYSKRELFELMEVCLLDFAKYRGEAYYHDIAQRLKRRFALGEKAVREISAGWAQLRWTSVIYTYQPKGLQHIRLCQYNSDTVIAQINAESQQIQPF